MPIKTAVIGCLYLQLLIDFPLQTRENFQRRLLQMSNHRFRVASLFLCSFIVTAGCENEESAANRRVNASIETSRQAYRKSDGNSAEAHKHLETAAKETAASAAAKATAKSLVAQSSFDSAVRALPELNTVETEAQALIRDMGRISSDITSEVALIESLKGQNPSASQSDPLKALSASRAKFTAQVGELDKNIQQLESQKQAMVSKISNLDTEHKSKLELAAGLMQKSEAAQGEESVNLFKQSTAVRQNASTLSRELQFARQDLARIEVLLADAQRSRKLSEESAAMAQRQLEQLNQGWSSTEEAIKARQANLAKMVNSENGLAALAKELAEKKAKAAELRKAIDENHLEPSIAAYTEADSNAKKLVQELNSLLQDEKNKDSPGKIAWQNMRRLNDPITYRLGKARALQLRGQLFAQERSLHVAQQNLATSLQPLLQKAGVAMPPELAPADLAAQLDTSHKSAVRDFNDSLSALKDILETDAVQRNTWPQANEARQLHVTVEYSLHHLEPDKGHLDAAKASIGEISKNGGVFPALPPDLETRAVSPVPIVASNRPTTNPANGAAEPAQGGTTETPITPEGAAALKNLLNRARGGAGGAGNAPTVPLPEPPAQQN